MKVLLIQPPQYYYGKSREPFLFPRGIGHIARVLLDAGHEVEVFDIYAHQYSDRDVVEYLNKVDFDIAAISAMSTQYNYVKWLSSELKRSHPRNAIILGGALATFSSTVVLENTGIDICVIGEGEITIIELLARLAELEHVPGIHFKKDARVVQTGDREYIKNLDEINFPAYERFPFEIYLKNSFVITSSGPLKIKTANIICGRGCPFDCNYCSRVFRGLRLRSVDNIIAEIIYLKERFGIAGIFFCDDTLTVKRERMHALCEKIRPLNLKWNCQGRVNNVDVDLLRHMKASGCTAVGYGIESGSQTILNNMNKMATVEQAERAIKNTVRAGLYPIVQVMFGYPGETRETLKETVDFFRRADNPGSELSPVTPLPGTRLWQDTLEKKMARDEKTLLESLDGGYMPDAPVVLNYTSFPQEEFDSLRLSVQNSIRLNYFRRHPGMLLKSFFLNLRTSLVKNGCRCTVKKIIVRCREYFFGKTLRL